MPHPRQAEALELLAQGVNVTVVARQLGLPRTTVYAWSLKVPPVSREDAKDMEIAALKAKLKIAEGTRPEIRREEPSEEPDQIAEVWRRVEADNAKRIVKHRSQAKFRATLREAGPVGLCFVSDQHISAGNLIDLRRMREDAEFIAATPGIYAILGGDGIDGHVKHRAAVLAARSTPDDQLRLYDYYLQILAEKILVVISGNHDAWLHQFSSVDMIKLLAERNKVQYSPHFAYLEVELGGVVYRVAVAHQYRFNSSLNQTHTVKQMLNFGENDFDIGCVGHHHEHAQESFRRRGLSRWVCRPGAYQIQSDYSDQYGFPPAVPTCPTAVIYPKERKIVGFDDVRDAAKFMKAESG